MGQGFQINENLVSQIALLASGSCCVAFGGLGGPAVAAFGVFAAPVLGIGGWSLAKWMKRFQSKDPTTHQTIRRIQGRINETLTGSEGFADLNQEVRGVIDAHLPKLIAEYWPCPTIIAELAGDLNGFPDAIAKHILGEINGASSQDIPYGFFEIGLPRDYANLIIITALNAALEDDDYFKSLHPHAVMQALELTGQIQRDVKKFQSELVAIEHCLGEVLGLLRDIRKTQLADSEMISAMFEKMGLAESGKIDSQVKEKLRQSIVEMLSSERQATQDAVKEIMADPPNPVAATNRLKQAIAEQSDARVEATQNEIEMWQEIATINYFNNGEEAKAAYEKILKLTPDDADIWNQLGTLNFRLGYLSKAVTAYKNVERIALSVKDNEYLAMAYGNMGTIFRTRGDLEAAMTYYNHALKIDVAQNNKKGMSCAYSGLGLVFLIKGEGLKAIDYFNKALELHKTLGDKAGMAIEYSNIGSVHLQIGDLVSAMENYEQAFELNKAVFSEVGMAVQHGNMGVVAHKSEDINTAKFHYEQALELNKKLGRIEGVIHNLGNLGNVALTKCSLDEAMSYFKQALEFAKELGSLESMACQYGGIGNVVGRRGNIAEAITYYSKSLELYEAVGSKMGIATSYQNIGLVLSNGGNKKEACRYWRKSLDLFQKVGAMSQVEQVGGWLKALEAEIN